MSTPDQTPSLPWLATLSRGTIYVLVTGPSTELRFDRGIPVPVSDATRDHLEEHAVITRTRFHDPEEEEIEVVETCSFTFEPNEETAP